MIGAAITVYLTAVVGWWSNLDTLVKDLRFFVKMTTLTDHVRTSLDEMGSRVMGLRKKIVEQAPTAEPTELIKLADELQDVLDMENRYTAVVRKLGFALTS